MVAEVVSVTITVASFVHCPYSFLLSLVGKCLSCPHHIYGPDVWTYLIRTRMPILYDSEKYYCFLHVRLQSSMKITRP